MQHVEIWSIHIYVDWFERMQLVKVGTDYKVEVSFSDDFCWVQRLTCSDLENLISRTLGFTIHITYVSVQLRLSMLDWSWVLSHFQVGFVSDQNTQQDKREHLFNRVAQIGVQVFGRPCPCQSDKQTITLHEKNLKTMKKVKHRI